MFYYRNYLLSDLPYEIPSHSYFFIFFISSCGDNKEEFSDTDTTTTTVLEGTWVSSCSTSNHVDETFTFSAQTISNTAQIYDENCSIVSYKWNISATFAIGSDYTLNDGTTGTQIDITFSSVTVTLLTDSSVTSFNNDSYCGITTWEKDVPTSITGLTCGDSTTPTTGTVLKDGFKLSGSTLYFGGDSDDNEYPTSITTTALTKQ